MGELEEAEEPAREVRRRVPRPGGRRAAGAGHPPRGDPALDHHGGLRRPDPHHRQERPRGPAAARGHAGPRARLPGLRHAARADRQRRRDRRAARGHLLLLRRHAARARLRDEPVRRQGRGRRRAHRLLAAGCAEAGARRTPAAQVVFFAVGFETTAPANAMAVWQAAREGIGNFSILVAHVLVPPAIEALLELAQLPRAGLPRRRATSAP